MEITFLGTGSGAPSRQRNVSATALQLKDRGEMWLIDCGEGTQHQILHAPQVRLSQLTRAFFTHLHGDHIFGIVGLLASRSLAQGGVGPVTLYGPEGLAEFVRISLRASGMNRFGFPVDIRVTRPGTVYEDSEITVTAAATKHRIEAYAYSVHEKPRPGRFDVDAARASGVPDGPLFGKLKAGQSVQLPDGRVILPDTLTGPPRSGRKIVFSGDTMFTPDIVSLAENADVVIHEATYSDTDRALADRACHSTAGDAANVALSANAASLYMTHFSSRYETGAGIRLDDLLGEARAIFPNTYLAHDLMRVNVARHA